MRSLVSCRGAGIRISFFTCGQRHASCFSPCFQSLCEGKLIVCWLKQAWESPQKTLCKKVNKYLTVSLKGRVDRTWQDAKQTLCMPSHPPWPPPEDDSGCYFHFCFSETFTFNTHTSLSGNCRPCWWPSFEPSSPEKKPIAENQPIFQWGQTLLTKWNQKLYYWRHISVDKTQNTSICILQ